MSAVCCFACHSGITLYLFDNQHQRFGGVRDAQMVSDVFTRNPPTNGGTNLSGVLDAAFKEHFMVCIWEGGEQLCDAAAHERGTVHCCVSVYDASACVRRLRSAPGTCRSSLAPASAPPSW